MFFVAILYRRFCDTKVQKKNDPRKRLNHKINSFPTKL